MSLERLIEYAVLAFLICVSSYAIYREADLIRFERKVKKYVKAFFKALYYTLKEKIVKE